MEIYEHINEFTVKYCDADFKDCLKASAALAYMEEVASSSAEELGFGRSFIKPRGYAFMVSSLYFECLKPIMIGDVIKIKTWPSIPSHVVFGREYQFVDTQGEPLINGTSRWCLIDMKNGKLLNSKVIDNQDYTAYNTKKLFEKVQWKVPAFRMEEGELKFTLTIANSEYDHNMHVNNTRYADYCLNCFSVEELADKALKRFGISYVKQCKEGETLRFYRLQKEDGSYLVQGFNEADEMVTQAQIEFMQLEMRQ